VTIIYPAMGVSWVLFLYLTDKWHVDLRTLKGL